MAQASKVLLTKVTALGRVRVHVHCSWSDGRSFGRGTYKVPAGWRLDETRPFTAPNWAMPRMLGTLHPGMDVEFYSTNGDSYPQTDAATVHFEVQEGPRKTFSILVVASTPKAPIFGAGNWSDVIVRFYLVK